MHAVIFWLAAAIAILTAGVAFLSLAHVPISDPGRLARRFIERRQQG
jgi:hypothetical protein